MLCCDNVFKEGGWNSTWFNWAEPKWAQPSSTQPSSAQQGSTQHRQGAKINEKKRKNQVTPPEAPENAQKGNENGAAGAEK